MKPEHAALRSKPHAFFALILFWTIAAVDGVKWSGVTVPTIITSISVGESWLFSKRVNAILVDISELEEDELNLPIQINGKFVSAHKVNKNYDENKIIDQILLIDKFKQRVKDNPIKKIIHVKNKILNIII